jgi:hypothetical protein
LLKRHHRRARGVPVLHIASGMPPRNAAHKCNAVRRDRRRTALQGERCGSYLPLSLSFDAVELFDMLSDGDADVVPDELEGDEELDDDGELDDEPLGAMLLLELLPDGVPLLDDELDVPLDGDEVDGLIVPVLELEGDVVLGVVVVELDEEPGVVAGVLVEVVLDSR